MGNSETDLNTLKRHQRLRSGHLEVRDLAGGAPAQQDARAGGERVEAAREHHRAAVRHAIAALLRL